MKIKRIASIAIIAALPFAANATQTIVTTQTPAAVGANGTVKKAATTGPYVTNEPTVDDQTHIATTAYVKGAYNDAIAAVNKVNDSKQDILINDRGDEVYGDGILGASTGESLAEEYVHYLLDLGVPASDIAEDDASQIDNHLLTAGGVLSAMVVSADATKNYTDSKRVKIYTTWDDDRDSATTLVEFATAQQ